MRRKRVPWYILLNVFFYCERLSPSFVHTFLPRHLDSKIFAANNDLRRGAHPTPFHFPPESLSYHYPTSSPHRPLGNANVFGAIWHHGAAGDATAQVFIRGAKVARCVRETGVVEAPRRDHGRADEPPRLGDDRGAYRCAAGIDIHLNTHIIIYGTLAVPGITFSLSSLFPFLTDCRTVVTIRRRPLRAYLPGGSNEQFIQTVKEACFGVTRAYVKVPESDPK